MHDIFSELNIGKLKIWKKKFDVNTKSLFLFLMHILYILYFNVG